MADGDSNEQSLYFPVLAGSWEPYAPPHTLGPEGPGLFRDSLNLIARYGILRKRPVLGASSLASQPSPTIWLASDASRHGEIPVWIWNGLSFNNQPLYIVVTSKQAYAYSSGAWTNITPTYTTGTITATNGSTAVSGAGTAWSTRHITKDQFILIDGTWYRIAAVGSDTTLTLASAFTGATAGGKAYVIRRVWGGGTALSELTQIYCQYFNGDLYVAGTYLGGADGSIAPAVLKMTNVTSSTTYLTGASAYISGIDLISGLLTISGLDVLQIGSVVFTGTDTSNPTSGVFYYSSHLDPTVWTVSPAGFELVYMKSGQINAMGKLAGNLTIHFSDGIVLAVPVAKAEPPVAFQRTDALVGCFSPRSLINCFGGERFVAGDARVYLFDGANSVMQGHAPYNVFGELTQAQLKLMTWATMDSAHGEYWAFYNTDESGGASTEKTVAVCHQVATNSWSKHQWAVPIGYISPRTSPVSSSTSVAVVGIANFDSETSTTKATMIYEWFEDSNTGDDSPAAYGFGSNGGNEFTTEDLDCGLPHRYKSMSRILLWVEGIADGATSAFTLYLRTHAGASPYASSSKTFSINTTTETLLQFSFPPVSVQHFRVTVGTTTSGALRCRLIRMLIYYEVGAEIVATEAL